MHAPTLNSTHQTVIIARLGEFCRFQGATLRHERDPWDYMRKKLLETEEPLARLKTEILDITKAHLLTDLKKGTLAENDYADYKELFERLLSRGDFVDVAMHLSTIGAGPEQVEWIKKSLGHVTANHGFLEERKPVAERAPSWEKLLSELSKRLDMDRLGRLLEARKGAARTKRLVLHRLRRNVAEYCAVMRVPLTPADHFTPFMLSRTEGLIAANLRFLSRYR